MMKRNDANILVVDDEEIVCKSFHRVLSDNGYRVSTTTKAKEAIKRIEFEPFDIVFVDIKMPDINGLTVLNLIKEKQPNSVVVIITGYPSIETTKQAIQSGAFDYLPKPLNPVLITRITTQALNQRDWLIHKSARIKPAPVETDNEIDNQCWLVYEGHGRIKIGLEQQYLKAIGRPVYIDLPFEDTIIKRDETLFRILTLDREIYDVISPVSGQIERVNDQVLYDIDLLFGSEAWIVQINTQREPAGKSASGKTDSISN